jgi:hypothetical protein
MTAAPKDAEPADRGFKYDLRSNIGQQHGSQGTLFGVSQRPRTQAGPKGFSPARQDEVRGAVDFVHADALAMDDGKGWLTSNPDGTSTGETKGRRAAARREVHDLISRTTAPMPKNDKVDVKVMQDDDHALKRGDGRAAGTYINPVSGGGHSQIMVALGAINRDEKRSHVLTHELGHADSWDKYQPSSIYDTPEKQGVEEAYADDFSVKHTPRRLKQLPNYQTPYPTLTRGDGFRQSYDGARKTHTSLDSALAAAVHNPNLPGGGHVDTDETKAAFQHANPSLPGMENARQFAAPGRRFLRTEYGAPHFEGVRQYENRVINRQDAAIKGAS